MDLIAQRLRADPKTGTIPIILLSAHAGGESRVEGMRPGGDSYLIKSFSARQLLARVEAQPQNVPVSPRGDGDIAYGKARSRAFVTTSFSGRPMRWLRVSRTKSPEMLRPEQVKSISARLAAAVIQNVHFSSLHQDEKHSGGLS
jgi:DNA-binding response OmpR family regulator